nr:hypothetical protein Iba_scaffold606243CG0010 [Ipomoea batatas]
MMIPCFLFNALFRHVYAIKAEIITNAITLNAIATFTPFLDTAEPPPSVSFGSLMKFSVEYLK